MLASIGLVQLFTFCIASSICLFGAVGVVALRNPVHNALSLVATLFGVAVLFIAQQAYFLAAIQVIVYAGAIVVLFLFVIMLLGVDRVQAIAAERKPSTLALGGLAGAAFFGLMVAVTLAGSNGTVTGDPGALGKVGALDSSQDVKVLGRVLFSDYVFAFEVTSILLTIAVIGAVVLSRRDKGDVIDLAEFPEPELPESPESSESEAAESEPAEG